MEFFLLASLFAPILFAWRTKVTPDVIDRLVRMNVRAIKFMFVFVCLAALAIGVWGDDEQGLLTHWANVLLCMAAMFGLWLVLCTWGLVPFVFRFALYLADAKDDVFKGMRTETRRNLTFYLRLLRPAIVTICVLAGRSRTIVQRVIEKLAINESYPPAPPPDQPPPRP